MFLSGLCKTIGKLGLQEESKDFSTALEAIVAAANQTNTMMWIGDMKDCPLDLSGQGQLLKHGKVFKRSFGGSIKKGKKWSSQKFSSCHLFLFQKTLLLCQTSANISNPNNQLLFYANHIRYVIRI